MPEGVPDCGEELSVIEGLDEKSERPSLQDGCAGGGILMASDEDHPSVGRFCAEVREEFHAGHSFHPDIQDGDLHRIIRDILQEEMRFAEGANCEPVRLKQPTYGFSDRCVVIDQADDLQWFAWFSGQYF
jgi:hypothetical protein